jgi:hypothetical protein
LLLRQAQLAIALHRFALLVVATLDLAHVERTLLLDAVCLATLLDDLLLVQCALLRGLLIGTRRHQVLLAVSQGLGLRGALLGQLLLLRTLLVHLARAHVPGMLGLLLASCLGLLGNLLALGGLLRRDALLGSLSLLGTAVDGSPVLGCSLLGTLRRFATHGGLLACLFGLCGGRVLLAGLGLRLFGLLLTAVLLVVTTRLLRARLCNGADGQDGADHDGQDVSTCGVQVHGDPRSGHGRRLLPRDALHGRAT